MKRTMKEFHVGCFAVVVVPFALGLITDTTPDHFVHRLFVSMFFFTLILWPLVMVFYLPYSVAVKVASGIRTPSSNRRAPAGLIESLCKQTGWVLSGQSGDRYRLQSGDHRSAVEIEVRYSERYRNVVLQSFLTIRFNLERPPSGLFGRLLLRNHALTWSAWAMNIGESCEACPHLFAHLPRHALNVELFGDACNEIANEHRAFRQELHDKFAYTVDFPGTSGGGMSQIVPQDGRGRITGQRKGFPALPDRTDWN